MPGNPKLLVSTKLLFATGDLSSSLTLAIQTYFQLYFLTDVARIPPATVAWIVAITRLWDAINDPIVGLLSDRIRSTMGRRRILLAYGSLPLGLAFMLYWLVPPWEVTGLTIYYVLIIIAFDTAFTVVNVGYNALTPLMTFDYDERSNLMGYRMVFSLGGTLAAILFSALMEHVTGSPGARFAVVGITLGVLAAIPPWIVFVLTRDVERDILPSNLSVRQAICATFSNRPFLMVAAMYLASWSATGILAATLAYYAVYYLHVPGQATTLILVAQGSAVCCVPFAVWLANMWDKPRAFIAGMLFWSAVLLAIYCLPPQAITWAYVLAFLCGPGVAAAAVLPWSMLPDVMEIEEQQTGQRREGAYYALIAFIQKLGTGCALWGIGQGLAASGFVTPTPEQPFPQQPEPTLIAIRTIIGPVAICLLLISLPFAWRYPISRHSHQQTLRRIGRSTSGYAGVAASSENENNKT